MVQLFPQGGETRAERVVVRDLSHQKCVSKVEVAAWSKPGTINRSSPLEPCDTRTYFHICIHVLWISRHQEFSANTKTRMHVTFRCNAKIRKIDAYALLIMLIYWNACMNVCRHTRNDNSQRISSSPWSLSTFSSVSCRGDCIPRLDLDHSRIPATNGWPVPWEQHASANPRVHVHHCIGTWIYPSICLSVHPRSCNMIQPDDTTWHLMCNPV